MADEREYDSTGYKKGGVYYEHMRAQKRKKRIKSFKYEIIDILQIVFVSLILVIFILAFIFRVVGVKGQSMEETLHNQDMLIITHLFYEPEQGDIVVVDLPEIFEIPIIKRVIATGGQTVDITEDGKVYVDGELLNEEYITGVTYPKDLDYPLKVPEGFLFVMGDNRQNSKDSRDIDVVDENTVLGKAVFRFYPFNKIGFVS